MSPFGQVLPGVLDNRNKELFEESLLGLIGRHLLILFDHEVGRARKNQIVAEFGEIHCLGGLEEQLNVCVRLVRLDHLFVRRLELRVRIAADIGQIHGHRGQAAATPPRTEIQNSLLDAQCTIDPAGHRRPKLIDRSVVELKDAVLLPQQIIGVLKVGQSLLLVFDDEL